jgi:plastocyanin
MDILMPLRPIPFVLLALTLSACGSSESTPATSADAGTADAGSTPDVPAPVDVATVTDTPSATDLGAPAEADSGAVAALNGCTSDLYVDQTGGTASDRMIMTRGSTNTFDFPCMTIRAGQAVQFMWAFSRHPLAPGLAPGEAGAEPPSTPIQPFSSGTVHSITFRAPGFYPFHCTNHPGAMKGVIQVL